jgi:hypothetical protein
MPPRPDVVPKPLDRRARLDSPRIDERPPPRGIGGKRLGRAARAVKRHHQVHPQVLAEREPVDQPLQLRRYRIAFAELDPGPHQLLERTDAQLLQAPDLALGELLVANVEKRRAAPEPERLAEKAGLLAGALVAGKDQKSLEAPRVDGVLADREAVAVARRLEERETERPAEGRDRVVERGARRARSAIAPQVVDQLVRRSCFTRVENERGDERAELPAAEPSGRPAATTSMGPRIRNSIAAVPGGHPVSNRMRSWVDTECLLPVRSR